MNIEVMVPKHDNPALQAVNNVLYQSIKYQLMWALRPLEQQMNQQNGIVHINQLVFDSSHIPQIQIEGFDIELTKKIRTIISLLQFEKT